MTTHALQRDRSSAMPDDFPEQLAELLAYYEDTIPPGRTRSRGWPQLPGRPERPEPWLLGSSPQSAIWAGELGLPYAFADFINPAGAEIAALYRRALRRRRPRRRAAHRGRGVGAGRRHRRGGGAARGQREMAFAMLRRGRLIAVPPVETALRFLASEGEAAGRRRSARTIVGTPATGARRARGGRRRLRRRGGDRGHDHPRPRRPAPLLRADRRSVRPRAPAAVGSSAVA